jgi:ADP-heptose:LPS heptosyltransferase
MKILVVNLLRLGDVIAMAPAIKALRRRYPGAEIHLMINSNFETAARLIEGVDVTLKFERDRIQRSCVDADRPMFEAYDWLQRFVDEASDQSYDMIFNFTHNRLSGWLCGLIESPQKVGLTLDGSGAVSFGSSWFRQLNQQVDFDDVQSFNHTDVFLGAVGAWDFAVEVGFFDGLLSETTEGRREARELIGEGDADQLKVAFQISTSDPKKEWGDARFRALAETLLRAKPEAVIFVTGAPDERERIEAFCRSCEVAPDSIRPAILSLAGVVSFLEEADLLVTGDTSIKHLASAGTVRVIELIVGSADAYRTGGWKTGDLLIASREACAPCGHSEVCHRTSHACALSIPVSSVALLAMSVLNREAPEIIRARMVGEKPVQTFIVDRSEGPAQLVPMTNEGLTDQSLALSIERASRRLALEKREGRFDKLNVGSEMLKVQRAILERFPDATTTDLRHALGDGEVRLRHAEGIVNSLKMQLLHLKESFQDPKRIHEMVSMVTAMRSRLQRNPWTRFVAEPLVQVLEDDRSAPFARFRKFSEAVQDLEIRLGIALKLLRGLETEFENGNSIKGSMGERL